LERDIRRRGAFFLYWDSNAFTLVNHTEFIDKSQPILYYADLITD